MNEKKNTAKRRSALRIMGSLIGLVKPLLQIMMAAIILGTMGYLCAIFCTTTIEIGISGTQIRRITLAFMLTRHRITNKVSGAIRL